MFITLLANKFAKSQLYEASVTLDFKPCEETNPK